jgi:hypothetical protein
MYITIIFRREPKFKETYYLSFLDEEIVFKAGNLRYTIIPKRVFQGEEEIKEFKNFIKIKVEPEQQV